MQIIKNFAGALTVALLVAANGALAAGQQAYYTGEKIKGYDKGSFVILRGDDVNFRVSAETGRVLKVLPHHSLLRVLGQDGAWLKADSDGVSGYIYAAYTGTGIKDELTQEDFALGYAVLGTRFDRQQANERLGTLQKETVDKKRRCTDYAYAGAVISVAKKKQLVQSIRVTDSKYITMRGVSVGDSAGRAVGQYGLPDAVVYEVQKTTYEYLWQDAAGQELRFALEVGTDSRVQAIILEALPKKH